MLVISDNINFIVMYHVCFLQEVLEVATFLGHAQLCATPGVPDHLPQLLCCDASGEVLHDLFQLCDRLRLRFHHLICGLRPEGEIEAGQIRAVRGPVVGTST